MHDFDDFAEEEIPPKLENIFFEKERHARPNEDKTQIINIGIEENPNLDRLNIETRGKKI